MRSVIYCLLTECAMLENVFRRKGRISHSISLSEMATSERYAINDFVNHLNVEYKAIALRLK